MSTAYRVVSGFAAGWLFAIGLGIAGMTDPRKIQGFLDLLSGWDPSLALVMVGAIGVNAVAWLRTRRREASVLGVTLPTGAGGGINLRLVAGAGIFGVGWALAGVCPGPGVVGVVTGDAGALTFFVSMLGGMGIFRLLAYGLPGRTRSAEAAEPVTSCS